MGFAALLRCAGFAWLLTASTANGELCSIRGGLENSGGKIDIVHVENNVEAVQITVEGIHVSTAKKHAIDGGGKTGSVANVNKKNWVGFKLNTILLQHRIESRHLLT